MNDQLIHETVKADGERSQADRYQVAEVKVARDSWWALLCQRKALEEHRLDPIAAKARVVEPYRR